MLELSNSQTRAHFRGYDPLICFLCLCISVSLIGAPFFLFFYCGNYMPDYTPHTRDRHIQQPEFLHPLLFLPLENGNRVSGFIA